MTEITCAELRKLRESGAAHQVIDVREPYEAEACSIGGVLIPMGEVIDRISEIRRDVPVILHCKSGNRSAAVIQALESRYGFSGLMSLKGGILAWSAEVEPLNCD
ncbi:MAG: rhodanese-like domain-containing protein [Flavobacteriales bacterium]|jgi:rhodanese-related sulfurtransferase|nr:rhodanese-like domain-containing protein [Flavobacteriales bacterium]